MRHIYNILNVRARGSAVLVAALLGGSAVVMQSCADSEGGGQPAPQPSVPVAFTTAVDDVTRATTGPVNSVEALQNLPEGFGVQAYLTEDKLWADARAGKDGDDVDYPVPDFMYNQPVTWDWLQTVTKKEGDVDVIDEERSVKGWVYTPLKYWPNYSNNDNNQPRHVSFFAYAPFVDVDPETGETGATTGITHLTHRNDKSPYVRYALGATGGHVDLLYAQCMNARRNGEGGVVVDGDGATTAYQRVPLTFHHALACVELYVQRIYDEQIYSGYHPEDDHTKLFVNKLVLNTGTTEGSALRGSGRLNLETGEWTDEQPIAKDGSGNYVLTLDETLLNDTVRGTASDVSADIISAELEKWDRPGGFGVDERLRPLVPLSSSLLFLPQETVTFVPTLSYTMVTRDDNLEEGYITGSDGHRYSRISHTQAGSPLTISLQQGKRYRLVVHIRTEHVSFEVAAVEDWDYPMRLDPTLPPFNEGNPVTHILNE